MFRKGVEKMKSCFPDYWLHTVAIKSNAIAVQLDEGLTVIQPAMKLCIELGLGFESASFGELTQALHVGTPPNVCKLVVTHF